MQNLTLFEAKRLAAYLKSSVQLVPQLQIPFQHGQWLNLLARRCGYRDWNAMSAIGPDIPHTEWGNWYRVFFGIALVVSPNGHISEHMAWYRNDESSRGCVKNDLVGSISAEIGSELKGKNIGYSRPDSPEVEIEVMTLSKALKRSKHLWYSEAPLVLTSDRGTTKILLWWLEEKYTMAEYMPSHERRFSYQNLSFHDAGRASYDWINEKVNSSSLTDEFILGLTGIEPTRRTCLYITELPNGPRDSFIPVTVVEGVKEGELLNLNFGEDRDAAITRAQFINSQAKVTAADCQTISQIYRQFEPKDEDYPTEFSGI